MSPHKDAHDLSYHALKGHFEAEPSIGEVDHLQGVSCLETSHGEGWKGAGSGSHNQGACQCGKNWTGARFTYFDTHPKPDGTSVQYRVDFRKYPNDYEGFLDLVKVMYVAAGREKVRQAAKQGNTYLVSKTLHDTGYYEGFGATVADRIQYHYRALAGALARDGKAEKATVLITSLPPTVYFGCIGEAVRICQRELQIAADGIFGRVTRAAVIGYQRKHGLSADGICGPMTWAEMFGDDYTPIENREVA